MVNLIAQGNFLIYADEPDIDAFLLSIGMEQSVIDQLPEGQKQLIYDSLGSDAEFCTFGKQGFCLDENGSLIQPQGFIDDSDLEITFVAYEGTISDVGKCYVLFPSFKWNILTSINNDSFAMALYEGNVAVGNDYNLQVMANNNLIMNQSFQPEEMSCYGYSYRIMNYGQGNHGYEGHAVLYSQMINPYAVRGINVKYIHDTSIIRNISYGVTIGAFSISVTPSNSYDIKNAVFYY